MSNLCAIDFFCSGGGMTHGFLKAGIKVIAGIDIDNRCKETYELNNSGAKFICKDIFLYNEIELQNDIGISKNDDDLIFIGCSPCQYWSLLNRKKESSAKTKDLLKEFARFVRFYNPGYVVIENVPNIIKNIKESGLQDVIDELTSKGYVISYNVYSLQNYGVPQTRKRFSLVADRVSKRKIEPKPSNKVLTVRDMIGVHNGFPKVEAGYRDLSLFQHTVSSLSKENLELVFSTPINETKSLKKRKSYSGSGFKDSYSRMSWDKPSPTITTKFYSISNGRFIHPEENRGISLREGATLQTFPINYVFHSKYITTVAKMIGNAVPPEFARRIGTEIIKSYKESFK